MLQHRLLSLVLFLIVLAADQGSKIWAIENIAPIGGVQVTNFFNLVFVQNYGVTFGMFQQDDRTGVWLLIGLSLVITLYLLWLWWDTTDPLEINVLMAVVAGALGNIIDRARISAVIDFLDFHLFGYHWPAFNIADCAIVVGIGLYVLSQLFRAKE